jgi:hypothetical protein
MAEPGAGATTLENAEQLGVDPALEVGADNGDSGDEAAIQAEENDPAAAQGIIDSILSEAYVLNLGTVLAQLEGPDFERLARQIQTSSALSQKEVEWVSVMMRALA